MGQWLRKLAALANTQAQFPALMGQGKLTSRGSDTLTLWPLRMVHIHMQAHTP